MRVFLSPATSTRLVWIYLLHRSIEHAPATLGTSIATSTHAKVLMCLFIHDGFLFSADFNACMTLPCGNNSVCTDLPPPSVSRACTCNEGYAMDTNQECLGNCKTQRNLTDFIYVCRLQCLPVTAVCLSGNVHGPPCAVA